MSKAEKTFNVVKFIRSLFKTNRDKPYRPGPQHVDPALVSFARLGLLSYYNNTL